jgi:hypothetical protein
MSAQMSDVSAPPPGESHAPAKVFALAAPSGFKRLLGGSRGVHRLSLAPQEIVVEHAGALRAPLRFAPGSVSLASTDAGAGRGRFPVLRRLSRTAIVPRAEGIEDWLWTSEEGSAMTVLGDDAPNVAFLFTPPLAGEVVGQAFEPAELEDLAKRAPLGEPAVFGLLVRVEDVDAVQAELARLGLERPLTDREVPPVQRRHLPDDRPANPSLGAQDAARASTSVPPPGFGGS